MNMNTENTSNRRTAAFTLIELLVVIAVIAVLAGFTVAVMGGVKKKEYIAATQSQLEQIATALESYKADFGFYPPCNTNNALTNGLFYELVGVTNTGAVANPTYQTLDGSSTISEANYAAMFNVGGIMNSTQNGGEETRKARSYLTNLKPGQVATNGNNVEVLVAGVGGPDSLYQPMTGFTAGNGNAANPFRYVYPGTNNPNSYDLWIQLSIGSTFNGVNAFKVSEKYLICNWSKQIQLNNNMVP